MATYWNQEINRNGFSEVQQTVEISRSFVFVINEIRTRSVITSEESVYHLNFSK